MCGATQAQTNLQASQAAFYQQMTDSYQTVFGEQQDVLNAVTASLQPIIAAGVNQEGFGAAEKTALNTQATEGVAQNYAKAQQALNEKEASLGGDAPTQASSGGALQLSGQLAATAASTESTLDTQITEADYDTGRQNYNNAVGEEEAASAQLNPTGYSNAATTSGTAEGTTANQIAQENNSVWTSVMAGLGGIAGQAVGNLNVGPFG